ncbi:MAG: hypothetical protein LBN04_10370 [Oscillospiraceae bacterium]|jgi:hypothetical protein|nr:hypothetical protein [Oscillospiraceae bacterium]
MIPRCRVINSEEERRGGATNSYLRETLPESIGAINGDSAGRQPRILQTRDAPPFPQTLAGGYRAQSSAIVPGANP